MANVLNQLSQKILPTVFGKLSGVGLTDLMDIKTYTATQGQGGGRIKGKMETIYCDVPVIFETETTGSKDDQGNRLTSNQQYTLKFPSHNATGSRYALDPAKHRLVVKARRVDGDEPAKVFRIINIRDLQGNLYEAKVVREDAE